MVVAYGIEVFVVELILGILLSLLLPLPPGLLAGLRAVAVLRLRRAVVLGRVRARGDGHAVLIHHHNVLLIIIIHNDLI